MTPLEGAGVFESAPFPSSAPALAVENAMNISPDPVISIAPARPRPSGTRLASRFDLNRRKMSQEAAARRIAARLRSTSASVVAHDDTLMRIAVWPCQT